MNITKVHTSAVETMEATPHDADVVENPIFCIRAANWSTEMM